MLSTFIIALREGLEAALIVGILVAYLVKTGRKALLAPLWAGVALAVVVSLATGAFLTFTSTELSPRGEEFFAGTTSFLAVGFVTWMVFWMKRTARHLKGQLEGQMSTAVLAGPLALAAAAFFAVVREGLETSLFIYANFKTVSSTPSASVGLILGLSLAITLGYLIYRSSIKINLSKFFNYTGIALVVVAAGVSLPHSSAAQSRYGRKVSFSSMKPGDLLFYGRPISHVGIYLGGGKMVHAPRSGSRVKVVSDAVHALGRKRLVAVRRF